MTISSLLKYQISQKCRCNKKKDSETWYLTKSLQKALHYWWSALALFDTFDISYLIKLLTREKFRINSNPSIKILLWCFVGKSNAPVGFPIISMTNQKRKLYLQFHNPSGKLVSSFIFASLIVWGDFWRNRSLEIFLGSFWNLNTRLLSAFCKKLGIKGFIFESI